MTVRAPKLLRMAEQIAANITVSEDPQIIAERTAEHLNRFWDLRMRVQFTEYYSSNDNDLSDILRNIVSLVRTTPDGVSG